MEYIKHQSHELRVNNNYFVVLLRRETSPQALVVSHKIRVGGCSDGNLDEYLVVSTVERCCKTANTMGCRFTTVTYLTALT